MLVCEFYRLWEAREDARPTAKELEQARQLLDEYGPRKAKDVLGKAVRRMKEQWPEAKTFGAIQKYVPDAARDVDREEHRRQQEQEEQLLRRREKEERTRQEAERIKFIATWRPVWDDLPDAEREAIRVAVLSGPKRHLKSVPSLAEKLCLIEMVRRQGGAIPCEIEA